MPADGGAQSHLGGQQTIAAPLPRAMQKQDEGPATFRPLAARAEELIAVVPLAMPQAAVQKAGFTGRVNPGQRSASGGGRKSTESRSSRCRPSSGVSAA